MKQTQPFLALLNADKATPEHWKNFLPEAERGLRQLFSKQSQLAGKLFQDYIRAWINSGFQPDGSEKPESRNYKTWNCQAIFESMESLLNCFLTIPQWGGFALQAANTRQTPQRGALSMHFLPRGGILAVPIVFHGQLRPEELAAWGFINFWESPFLFKIMRCSRCGLFDIPARKVRATYVRGWHCEKCRNIAGAEAATAKTRASERNQWFSLAVSAWLEFEKFPRHNGNDRVAFVTGRVNDRLPALQRIKRNSISRNLTDIQAEARRRKDNAKG